MIIVRSAVLVQNCTGNAYCGAIHHRCFGSPVFPLDQESRIFHRIQHGEGILPLV
jgi:hypothetical protein